MDNTCIQTNRESWDLRTGIHIGSEFYDVNAFRSGKSTLHKPELDLLGDVSGKRILHLQCHFGLDSMSWARLGAKVTAVDFSSKAISTAKSINSELGLDVEFIECDVQNLGDLIQSNSYDFVISSYGVLCWLGNLSAWSAGIKRALKPGGRFILVEFHPILDILYNGSVSGSTQYFTNSEPFGALTTGTYTNRDADITYFEYRWQHSISKIINICVQSGLKLINMDEYPYCPYKLFPELDIQDSLGNWMSSNKNTSVPYLYSLAFES